VTVRIDVRARFLPRFLESGARRIERARALADRGDFGAVAIELHALAGEAALLQLRSFADLAGQAEDAARGSPEACAGILGTLQSELAAIAATADRARAGAGAGD
jgi:HPt (histidine-containing phosphotransfer) domain-containing protein